MPLPPNYQRSDTNERCGTCRYSDGGHCTLYDVQVDPSFTCDSWVSAEETHTPVQASVMKKHSSVPSPHLAEKVATGDRMQEAFAVGKQVLKGGKGPLKKDEEDRIAKLTALGAALGFGTLAARRGKGLKKVASFAHHEKVEADIRKQLREALKTRNWALVSSALKKFTATEAAEAQEARQALKHMPKEKTAMPSKKSILKALGVGGAGAAAGGAAGYVTGHRTGMARDKETPYGPGHMRFAYQKGQVDLARRLRARIASRQSAAKGKEKKASVEDLVMYAFFEELEKISAAQG